MASKDTKPTGKDPLRDLLDEKSLADEITNAIAGNDCPGDKEFIAYIRRELQDAERVEIKSHLIFCGRCRDREKTFQKDLTFKVDESKPQAQGKSHQCFRSFKLSPTVKQRPFALTVTLAATAALGLGIGSYLLLLWTGTSVSFGGKFVHAQGEDIHLHKSQPFQFEVRTPQAVYLIQITIDGDGRIVSGILPGKSGGQYLDKDVIQITPAADGDYDLYLIPCQASEGFPNRVLDNILQFVKTEKSLSRVNQRRGIEMALSLYRVKFIHEICQVKP